MTGPWRCFHCGTLCTTQAEARAHFGDDESARPACQIRASEGGLLRALREAERDAAEAWHLLHLEGSQALRAARNAGSRHHEALSAMEETGYERGLRERDDELGRLRRIVFRYCDRARMSNAPPHLQQEVDEAMRWAADHPEDGR